jgi:predicted nucleotidyltransferase
LGLFCARTTLFWLNITKKDFSTPLLSPIVDKEQNYFVILHHKLLNYPCMSTKAMQQTIADYFKTQPVQRAWLFGSFARGEETPLSDVDLLVVYDDKARVSLLKHAAMICELEKILDRPVDIVQEKTLRPRVRESVNQDRKLIYERER